MASVGIDKKSDDQDQCHEEERREKVDVVLAVEISLAWHGTRSAIFLRTNGRRGLSVTDVRCRLRAALPPSVIRVVGSSDPARATLAALSEGARGWLFL